MTAEIYSFPTVAKVSKPPKGSGCFYELKGCKNSNHSQKNKPGKTTK